MREDMAVGQAAEILFEYTKSLVEEEDTNHEIKAFFVLFATPITVCNHCLALRTNHCCTFAQGHDPKMRVKGASLKFPTLLQP